MNVLLLSRFLGWFSLGLGLVEAVVPRATARTLGLYGRTWLVRAFGFREIAAGLAVLARPEDLTGPAMRVGGDVLDMAVLASALSRRNPRRNEAHAAFAAVLGALALDVACVAALVVAERRRAATAEQARRRHPSPLALAGRRRRGQPKLA